MLAALQMAFTAFVGPVTDTVSLATPPATETRSLTPTIENVAPTTFQSARFDPGTDLIAPDTTRRKSIEYGNGYYLRLKIHRYASWAMLPLFIGSYATGSDLINHGNSASSFSRNWHGVFAGATAGLFLVNTVTGVWNLVDSRRDPAGGTRRWVHSIAMLVAEAGFAATGATAPETEGGQIGEGSSASTHRALAISSMTIATASWLMMLLWKD